MQHFSSDRPFYTFLREERQFSFLLAALLMQKGDALRSFVELLNARLPESLPASPDALAEAEVYVEFAYLRDKWNSMLPDERTGGRIPVGARQIANQRKLQFVEDLFRQVPSLAHLAAAQLPTDTADFNAHFMGDAGRRITKDIASPALWSVKFLAATFGSSPEVFLDLCRLKWSFHIKPDVVVLIPGAPPICVEAKLESGEGSYPTGQEATIVDGVFGRQTRVRQFELQQFMFENLLGRRCVPVVVQKRYPKTQLPYPVLIWGEVFSSLATEDARQQSIPFVSHLVAENASLLSSYAEHRIRGGG